MRLAVAAVIANECVTVACEAFPDTGPGVWLQQIGRVDGNHGSLHNRGGRSGGDHQEEKS